MGRPHYSMGRPADAPQLLFMEAAAAEAYVRPSTGIRHDSMDPQLGASRIFRSTVIGTGAFLVLVVNLQLSSFAAFPIGGGEYHAIFAYTESGRVEPALIAFVVYSVAIGLTSAALLLARLPLDWRVVAILAATLSIVSWFGIVRWSAGIVPLGYVSLALLPVAPAIALIVTRLAEAARRRLADAHSAGTRARRLVQVVALSVLAIPGVWVAALFLLANAS